MRVTHAQLPTCAKLGETGHKAEARTLQAAAHKQMLCALEFADDARDGNVDVQRSARCFEIASNAVFFWFGGSSGMEEIILLGKTYHQPQQHECCQPLSCHSVPTSVS